jgi:hypothetical protein
MTTPTCQTGHSHSDTTHNNIITHHLCIVLSHSQLRYLFIANRVYFTLILSFRIVSHLIIIDIINCLATATSAGNCYTFFF